MVGAKGCLKQGSNPRHPKSTTRGCQISKWKGKVLSVGLVRPNSVPITKGVTFELKASGIGLVRFLVFITKGLS